MTERLCPYHQHHDHHNNLLQRFFAGLLFLVGLVLVAILVIWLVLRPTKPRFYLQDASVYSFNTTGGQYSNLLNSNIQVTITSRNPNDRIGVYYDRLDAYATYKYQPITPAAAIPPSYQGHNDVTLWSPFLCGVEVPLAPYLAAALEQDHAAGALLLYVKMDGRVRWKVGSWTTGHYHLFVNCPAVLTFGGGWSGAADGTGGYAPVVGRFEQRMVACSVSV